MQVTNFTGWAVSIWILSGDNQYPAIIGTALLPIIAGYQLLPDKIQIDITWPQVHPKSGK